jgi:type II secretory pathway pseudopilin PulG
MLDSAHSRVSTSFKASIHSQEDGYTLVALIALMTLIALVAMAAAPRIAQQGQREREQEAIFRGEEVAEAIRLYYLAQTRNGRPPGDTALPTDMDQLVEGVQVGKTKKLQVLRASAARDPLSKSGEWRLVKPRSTEITDFVRDVMLYSGNIRPATTDTQLRQVELLMAPPVIAGMGLKTTSSGSSGSLSGSSSGPFIGVSSESGLEAVITYYGIDHHNHWVFTPLFR